MDSNTNPVISYHKQNWDDILLGNCKYIFLQRYGNLSIEFDQR